MDGIRLDLDLGEAVVLLSLLDLGVNSFKGDPLSVKVILRLDRVAQVHFDTLAAKLARASDEMDLPSIDRIAQLMC